MLSTYNGALDSDLTPFILKNALASGNRENIKFVENICELLTVNVLVKILEG